MRRPSGVTNDWGRKNHARDPSLEGVGDVKMEIILPFADHITALEQVTVSVSVCGDALRREHEDVLIVQWEEVRALPHVTHAVIGSAERAGKLPVL